MATVLLSKWMNAFYGIRYVSFWHFISTFGSSRIASPAYQTWPIQSVIILMILSVFITGITSLFIHSLRRCWQNKNPPLHLIIIFTNQYYYHFNLPKGIFRWNQLLDSSMSLSPLYSNMTSNLHVNTAWFFHQSFLRLQTVQV